VDLSVATGRVAIAGDERRFTQAVSRWAFERAYQGIVYTSRLHQRIEQGTACVSWRGECPRQQRWRTRYDDAVVICGVSPIQRHEGGAFSLKYHLVRCPKYRRPVLVDAVADRLRRCS